MAYIKKNLTKEERSEIGRRANAARKTHGFGRNGGRPPLPKEERKRENDVSICITKTAAETFRKKASLCNLSVKEFMHQIAVKYKNKI